MSSDGDNPSAAMVDDKQPKNVADILAGPGQVMIHTNLLHRHSAGILDSELDHTANHCLFLFCTDSPGRCPHQHCKNSRLARLRPALLNEGPEEILLQTVKVGNR